MNIVLVGKIISLVGSIFILAGTTAEKIKK